ncbi:MAG TPA: ABC transporter permease [Draconibacterium sp.]|nr:ABC transporter permease [Draconibacterium sp.]
MLLNGIKIFVRKVVRQKLFFGINLVGLTVGMFFAILAFLYIQDEFRYDKHFTNTDDVYLLSCNNGRNRKLHRGQPAIFMDRILTNIPEIRNGIRINWSDENMLANDIRMEAIEFCYADADFFNFLGWQLVSGKPNEVLAAPMTITISEKMATQLFGDKNAVGQIVNIGNKYDYTITGIYKDFPDQAYIDVDFIASISSFKAGTGGLLDQWGWHSSWIYLKVPDSNNLDEVESKIASVWNQHTEDEHCKGDYIEANLQSFKDNYIKSGEITGLADPFTYIIGFSIIALLILIISSFNFVNLSMAINGQRSSENQIKRVLGANHVQLIRQIVFEVLIYLGAAILLSSVIIKISLPAVNAFLNKHIQFYFLDIDLILFLTIVCIVLLAVCGLSTAVLFIKRTDEKQSYAIRSASSKIQKGFRNSLVTVQFTIGIILIASTIAVNQQLKLIRQHDLGFEKEQILAINNDEGNNGRRYELFKEALKKYPEIVSVSCGTNAPVDGVNNFGGATRVDDNQISMEGCAFVAVDHNYLNLIEAEFLQGRNFADGKNDNIDQVIITETMAKKLQLKDGAGTFLTDMWGDRRREVIGVVKDIEYETIHEANVPIAFFYRSSANINYYRRILVKLTPVNLSHILSVINDEWKNISPEYPINYQFLDKLFDDNYSTEVKTGKLLGIMAFVAIFLSGMGLFALALFHINSKVKEIGIRKVNGAKVIEIITMLNLDFLKWIVIAILIATPLVYFIMHKWLENFAYKTTLSWWIFALAGVLALGIALLTVSWQSWRAATRNPVEALRYE